MTPRIRLWRARKRHDHLDADVQREEGRVELVLSLNGRTLVSQPFRSMDAAESAADRRLRELQRAGWNTHW